MFPFSPVTKDWVCTLWWPKMDSSYFFSYRYSAENYVTNRQAMKKWPNRKKWCSNPVSYRHFSYLSCTDRYTSIWKSQDALTTPPAQSYSDHCFCWHLLTTSMYFKAHMFLEDICWKYRYSFAHVTLNNLEASRHTACGVRFSLTSWNFEGSLISPDGNSMSHTLQYSAADTSLRMGKNIVSEGHRHILPGDKAWLLAQGRL